MQGAWTSALAFAANLAVQKGMNLQKQNKEVQQKEKILNSEEDKFNTSSAQKGDKTTQVVKENQSKPKANKADTIDLAQRSQKKGIITIHHDATRNEVYAMYGISIELVGSGTAFQLWGLRIAGNITYHPLIRVAGLFVAFVGTFKFGVGVYTGYEAYKLAHPNHVENI